MTNPNDNVHPIPEDNGSGGIITMDGLTKRELFAAMALQGVAKFFILKNEIDGRTGIRAQEVAEFSVNLADALIAELNKETK